jgi:MFS family permease
MPLMADVETTPRADGDLMMARSRPMNHHDTDSAVARTATIRSDHTGGALTPLRHPVFAVVWSATVLGNIGNFMRDVASAWTVTDLSASPVAVGLIQAAATLPGFLLTIPAGALSDIVDRRRFLILVQTGLAAVSAILLWLSYSGGMTVELLIALTFVAGAGAALSDPSWQAIVPELVPRNELRNALALDSLGVNIARAIGPAAAGALLASFGAAVTYGVDVIGYAFVIAALVWWPRPRSARDSLSEHFTEALGTGLRYARANRELHRVLLHAFGFLVFASAVWALMPLLARQLLAGTSSLYGLMLGAIGIGAIVGAMLLPRIRSRLGADGLLLTAALMVATVVVVLAWSPPAWLALGLLPLLGAGWLTALTTLNAKAQAILPDWVRGRGMAVYLTVFSGSMSIGSLTWGLVAAQIGVAAALLLAGTGLAVAAIALHRSKLPTGEKDLRPSHHWPEPDSAQSHAFERGPVMVQVTYRVRALDRPAFLQAMRAVAAERKRDGAFSWGITENTADPEQLMEWFLVRTWAEHLRQHDRVSRADAEAQVTAAAFHFGTQPPVVEHFLALEPTP